MSNDETGIPSAKEPMALSPLLSNMMEFIVSHPEQRGRHAVVISRRTYENLKSAGLVPHCYDGSQEDWGDVHHEH